MFVSVFFVILSSIAFYFTVPQKKYPDDDITLANPPHRFESRYITKLRWFLFSRQILDTAYQKFKGVPYRIERGDRDVVVIPTELIPELNILSKETLSSRAAHAYNLGGNFSKVDIVIDTNIHGEAIQHRITPQLPKLLDSIKNRVGLGIEATLQASEDGWATERIMDHCIHIVSRVIAFTAIGAPICDDPKYIALTSKHARHVFTIAVILRFIPVRLRDMLVWLIPAKWQLESDMQRISDYAIPGLEERQGMEKPPRTLTTLDNMLDLATTTQESDPKFVAKLQSALNAGGVHPTAILVVNVLFDLAEHPGFQDALRHEIKAKHIEVNGHWDHKAFDTLYKLDSTLKETLRFNPATLAAYTRVIQQDCELSTGLRLQKGQLICVPSCSSQKDPVAFPGPETYNALRSYEQMQQGKYMRPFKSIDEHAHRWGSGRSACPGRFLASLAVKVILVKLLDEFEFRLRPGTGRLDSTMAHEFIWVSLNAKLMVKRRVDSCGIVY